MSCKYCKFDQDGVGETYHNGEYFDEADGCITHAESGSDDVVSTLGLRLANGSVAVVRINYCPWCGRRISI